MTKQFTYLREKKVGNKISRRRQNFIFGRTFT